MGAMYTQFGSLTNRKERTYHTRLVTIYREPPVMLLACCWVMVADGAQRPHPDRARSWRLNSVCRVAHYCKCAYTVEQWAMHATWYKILKNVRIISVWHRRIVMGLLCYRWTKRAETIHMRGLCESWLCTLRQCSMCVIWRRCKEHQRRFVAPPRNTPNAGRFPPTQLRFSHNAFSSICLPAAHPHHTTIYARSTRASYLWPLPGRRGCADAACSASRTVGGYIKAQRRLGRMCSYLFISHSSKPLIYKRSIASSSTVAANQLDIYLRDRAQIFRVW